MVPEEFEGSSDRALRQQWFEVDEIADGVYSILEPLHEEAVRSYLVLGSERAVLVDTGMGVGDMRALVSDLTSFPITVVNSHAHWDHIGGNHQFEEIVIHQAEAHQLPLGVSNARLRPWFDPAHLRGDPPAGFDIETVSIPPSAASLLLSGGERFELGGRTLEIMHAPGHSPGGIVLLDRANAALFSTDVAYAGSLYAFGEDADVAAYRRTMALLVELAPVVANLYPSHGASPISPGLLPAMRAGLEAAAAGRSPDAVDKGVARHAFEQFSILVDSDATEDR